MMCTEVWEVYKENSQECLCAKTKQLACNFATHIFGSFDTVEKTKIYLSNEDQIILNKDGFLCY